MTYRRKYKTCNWPKIVNYNFSSTLVDFALSAVTLHVKIWSQARGLIMWQGNSLCCGFFRPLIRQGATAFANSYFSVFVSLISLVVFLTAGSDPELPLIDFDSNSSSTRLTASKRSWSVSSWQRDSCSWWRNVLKRSRNFISAYLHNQIDLDCLLILHSAE